MNHLIINLTGEIIETNFDEWKKDLLVQIESTRKELKSDEDFALATDQANGLKQAETALKKAKESAIEQAADIQSLFAAIDEISAAARDARLFLERQIKERKQEIKDGIVSSGIRKVRALIEEQNADFQLLNTREYTDRGLFEDAIKGKRGIEGMAAAVGLLVDKLRREITVRAAAVENRAKTLARVDPEFRALFQDRAGLLSQSDEELGATIASRIQVSQREQAALAETVAAEPAEEAPETGTRTAEAAAGTGASGESEKKRAYRIILGFRATGERAESLVREIRERYANRDIVQSIELQPDVALEPELDLGLEFREGKR